MSGLDIFDECGLRYAATHHNPEALSLFPANGTHLVVEKKRSKWMPRADEEATPLPRNLLLSYKTPTGRLPAFVPAAVSELRAQKLIREKRKLR